MVWTREDRCVSGLRAVAFVDGCSVMTHIKSVGGLADRLTESPNKQQSKHSPLVSKKK